MMELPFLYFRAIVKIAKKQQGQFHHQKKERLYDKAITW